MLICVAAVFISCGVPQADRIVFVSERDGDPEIYIARTDGMDLMQLTANSVEDSSPAVSPDGRRFLYLSRRGAVNTFELMTGTLDTAGTDIQLTSDVYDELHASWAPDGQRICFSRNVNGRLDIWVTDDRGEDQEPITTNPGSDTQPEWAPTGERIAYISAETLEENPYPQVCIINSDGTGRKRLTDSPAAKMYPSWSADGTFVYYVEYDPGKREPYVLMQVDTETGETGVVLPFREEIDRPFVSDDGKKVLYSIRGKGLHTELYMYDLIAGQEIRLTNNSFRDFMPRWVK